MSRPFFVFSSLSPSSLNAPQAANSTKAVVDHSKGTSHRNKSREMLWTASFCLKFKTLLLATAFHLTYSPFFFKGSFYSNKTRFKEDSRRIIRALSQKDFLRCAGLFKFKNPNHRHRCSFGVPSIAKVNFHFEKHRILQRRPQNSSENLIQSKVRAFLQPLYSF